MSPDRPEYSVSPEQARINIAAAQEAIDYACAHGLKVLPIWLETIRQNEQILGSPTPLYGTHPRGSTPELLETGSGFEITLCASVAEAIEREISESFWRFESREIESGGWLYAHYKPDDRRVSVVHASGPGSNGRHGDCQVRLSDPDEVKAGFDDLLARARLLRVGDWHSHPTRDPVPSNADLANWGRHSENSGVLPYAGVIVTPVEVGWMTPEFHGWVIREDDDGLLVCEPGKIGEPRLG
jgi:proteasome lid subunit RPN8/RPN11